MRLLLKKKKKKSIDREEKSRYGFLATVQKQLPPSFLPRNSILNHPTSHDTAQPGPFVGLFGFLQHGFKPPCDYEAGVSVAT